MHVNKTKFERNSSPEYYHMTCIGQTKHTSLRGLFVQTMQAWVSLIHRTTQDFFENSSVWWDNFISYFTLNIVPSAAIQNRSVNVVCSNSVLMRIPDIFICFSVAGKRCLTHFQLAEKVIFLAFERWYVESNEKSNRHIRGYHLGAEFRIRRRITLCSINKWLQGIVTCALHNWQYHRKYYLVAVISMVTLKNFIQNPKQESLCTAIWTEFIGKYYSVAVI